ncbi:uncharacterized protein LOC122501928 [Leptopilina heterotoma]|uniref:uncharacterized protein LOC122501928 n=1 Tax=Leptopilina heterotoma TaxID=63436 RepID=UPI001CA85E75|nr:uncharacterized protein LOC122501928 [Leptopilina heterotoma]
MFKSYQILLIFILSLIIECNSYKILVVYPFNSPSHNIFLESISIGLAKRGNQIDAISHYKPKNPPDNYKTIVDLNGTRTSVLNNMTIDFATQIGTNTVTFIATTFGNELCELMGLDKMQELIKNSPKHHPYDLIITEAFGSNCYIGLGYIFKVPVITISSCLEYSWIPSAIGNPDSTAFAPDVLMDSAEIKSFWERLKNTFVTQFSRYQFYMYTESYQTNAMRKYLSPDIPDIRQVERSVALTFVNSFYTLFGIRTRTPAIVDIAGVHIEENDEKLSPDLQKWMDDSRSGVIYFSMGSMVMIETLPKETLLAFYESFEKLSPMRVLMKIANPDKLPPGLPKNVLTRKWIPQIPVLGHNNTKLFMTHGGLIGTQEALYHAVPMIGMPIYADQFFNVRIFVQKNMAIRIDYQKITTQSLDSALYLVLNNPLYRESARYQSRLFRDRPMSAGDTVDFWVRYVIRNGGNALKSPAVNLYWWQLQLLDVYIFILICLILTIYFILIVIKRTLRILCRRSKKSSNHQKMDNFGQNHFLFKLSLVLMVKNCFSDGYRILAIFPYNSRSHNNVFEGVTRGLAKRGHQVDAVTHFQMLNPPKNYRTIINLSGTRSEVVNNFTVEFVVELQNLIPVISKMFGNDICELLNNENLQKLIKSPPNDPPYDILITQSFASNCFIGIGYILKIPVITVSASLEFPWASAAIGNPDSIAFAPNVLMNTVEILTFWKRLKNLLISYRSLYEFHAITDNIQTEMMRKHLRADMPHSCEIIKTTSLTFINSYHSLTGIRLRSPALIDIAPIHLEDAPLTISKELEVWLNESKHGVVYFSLGSLVVIETLPKETLLAIFSSFKKISPVRVVMKIVNKEKLPNGLPSNVLSSKWIPQLQVLRHKNTKLFITHGGLMSTIEALYFCVPVIGLPLFYDQFFNVDVMVKKHMAIELDINKINEHSLDNALNEILNNSTYRESAKLESRLFHDRPMNATETVNFWVEYVIRNGVTRGLAKRGHQVDAVTHFEMKNSPKNYQTIINLSGTRRNVVNNFTIDFATQLGDDLVPLISVFYGNELCELLAHKDIQRLVKNPPNDPPYDILITEAFTANCFIGIGHILKVPVITVSSLLEFSWTSDHVGNPDSIAFAPNVMMDAAKVTTFWERLENTIITYRSKFRFFSITEEAQTKLMRKYLSSDIPNIREVEKSTALTFINSFHTLFGIRIRSPALIDIAGIHVEDSDVTVSQSLEKWLDESAHGVVYFTLGSMVLIETLPKETLLEIYSAFEKIAPVRVLMKIANKDKLPPGLPSNVLISDWIPQLQVMRHNNTRLFITHGGLISTLEALYNGVPLIGLPLYADQFSNIRIFVNKNMAIRLNYKKLTKESLDEALDAVLNNPKYREAAKYESKLFRDRPMTATETVNFWVEYVIRNGADSLRSPAVNLNWWQLALLDVYGFLLFCSVAAIYFLLLIIRRIFFVFNKQTTVNQKKKKN